MPHARFLSLVAITCLAALASAAEPLVKSGESIAFLGDSITEQGANSPSGYVRLVISGLEANGITVTPFPAGVGGNTSIDMMGRVQRDVIDKKPTWMTLSCGVNDVWRTICKSGGIPLDQYKTNITTTIDRAQAAGIKVMVLTATMIGDPASQANTDLASYNQFLRSLAAEKHCPLADLNADMQALVAARKPGAGLTTDGIHMNHLGNQMMALGVLRTFGLDQAQLDKATSFWLDIPKAVQVPSKVQVSLRQHAQLTELAARQGRSIGDLCDELLAKAVAEAAGVAPRQVDH